MSIVARTVSSQTLLPLAAAAFNVLLLATIPLLFEALLSSIIVISSLLVLVQVVLLRKTHWMMKSVKHITLVKNVGALAFSGLIIVSAKQLGLLNAMVNLLFSGVLLWLVTADLNNSKWAKQVFVVSLLLTAVSFIYQQDLQWSLYALMVVLGLFVTLYLCQSQSYQSPDTTMSIKPPHFFVMVLSCLVLSAATFVLMPALSPFWKLPEQKQSSTGLSDTMTPGDIAQLASSNRLAFRVELSGNQELVNGLLNDHASQYWRVLTLEDFNGKTWRQNPQRKVTRSDRPTPSPQQQSSLDLLSSDLSLSIIAEPSHQPWLLTYGTSMPQHNQIMLTNDSRLLSTKSISKRIKYQAQNLAPTNVLPVTESDLEINTRLPNNSNPKVRALSQALLANISTEQRVTSAKTLFAFNRAVLNYFSSQGFVYTLSPRPLSGEHLDDFMFESKQGFCAHYASVHAFMLRSIGVPARVVTGYHGSELNPNGQYLNIYDRSAHAWVEYLTPDQQWQRIDPTGAVSPERIQSGLEVSLQAEVANQNAAINFVKQTPWLNQLRQQLQSLDYYWTVWVLDFDNNKRENVVKEWFSLASFGYLIGALITSCFLLFIVWLIIRHFKQPKLPPERQVLTRLYKALSATTQKPDLNQIDWTMSLQQHQQVLTQNAPEYEQQILQIIQTLNRNLYDKDHIIDTRALCNIIETLNDQTK